MQNNMTEEQTSKTQKPSVLLESNPTAPSHSTRMGKPREIDRIEGEQIDSSIAPLDQGRHGVARLKLLPRTNSAAETPAVAEDMSVEDLLTSKFSFNRNKNVETNFTPISVFDKSDRTLDANNEIKNDERKNKLMSQVYKATASLTPKRIKEDMYNSANLKETEIGEDDAIAQGTKLATRMVTPTVESRNMITNTHVRRVIRKAQSNDRDALVNKLEEQKRINCLQEERYNDLQAHFQEREESRRLEQRQQYDTQEESYLELKGTFQDREEGLRRELEYARQALVYAQEKMLKQASQNERSRQRGVIDGTPESEHSSTSLQSIPKVPTTTQETKHSNFVPRVKF
eukprot:TRINITY_DN2316_c0_g4_i1.p1 TRINITY_DN2316_c0_g4~~TRINITY_DN2316_c0_g4_i1.p1  ORF type:complete len:344 (+),score=34.59 TRINITY_DN2316_c0_g4_i1:536-1567(+)